MTQVDGINPGDVVANSGFRQCCTGQCQGRHFEYACSGKHQREQYTVNPSRQFILRPVASHRFAHGSAIFLVGVVGYTQLHLFLRIAGGRLSNNSGAHVLSGSKPRCNGDDGDGSVGTSIWRTPGFEPDDFHQFWRDFGCCSPVRPSVSNIDGRGEEVQSAINAQVAEPLARQPARRCRSTARRIWRRTRPTCLRWPSPQAPCLLSSRSKTFVDTRLAPK